MGGEEEGSTGKKGRVYYYYWSLINKGFIGLFLAAGHHSPALLFTHILLFLGQF
jgi:hypothetical protein